MITTFAKILKNLKKYLTTKPDCVIMYSEQRKHTHKKEKGDKKMKYSLIIAGTKVSTWNTKEEAEKALYIARNSFLALVHPQDVFRIEKEK